MKDFFRYEPTYGTITTGGYTTFHYYFMIILIAFLVVSVVVFRKRIRQLNENALVFKIIGIILILNGVAFYLWIWINGGTHVLPLTYCPLSGIITGIVLLTGNKFFYPYVFFTGAAGSILGLFFANSLIFGPSYFRFYTYYISHSAPLLFTVYLIAVRIQIPNFRETLRAIGINWTVAILGVTANIVNGWYTRYAEINPYLMYSDQVPNLSRDVNIYFYVIAIFVVFGALHLLGYSIIYATRSVYSRFIRNSAQEAITI